MTGPIEQAATHQRPCGDDVAHLALPKSVSWDQSLPLGLGYLQMGLLPAAELAETKSNMKGSAFAEGFVIGAIYMERAETSPAAFEALIDAINRYEVKAVVIPNLLHLAELAATNNIKEAFKRATGARLIMVGSRP
ncbi:hypothetical protein [Kribbella sp. DT2]|uniref:hypothetical protein n=1 Tax=Kribbella sp. DT2 TaxID=3393427 RepID=UPI003CE8247B